MGKGGRKRRERSGNVEWGKKKKEERKKERKRKEKKSFSRERKRERERERERGGATRPPVSYACKSAGYLSRSKRTEYEKKTGILLARTNSMSS